MVSTNQVPFCISTNMCSGQSTVCLGFRADKFSITSLILLFLCFGLGQIILTRYGSFLVRTAQTMRAALFAIATAATLPGFRAMMSANHGSYRSGFLVIWRIRDIMPMTSNRRMYRSPIFEIRPNCSLPPLERFRGVRPSQAAKSRPVLYC